jgi:hypothetical protein
MILVSLVSPLLELLFLLHILQEDAMLYENENKLEWLLISGWLN